MANWNERFLGLTNVIASWSKDTSRGVGAVIADRDNRIISVGYNGFPRGADDEITERYERPQKYLYTEHAERNSLYSAANLGISTKNTVMYCTLFPCADCARAIIQSGITEVVTYENEGSEIWGDSWKVALELFKECNVKVTMLKK